VPASKPKRPTSSNARSFRTPFVTVPQRDWPAVAAGTKRELRQPLGKVSAPSVTTLKLHVPIPVVGYTKAAFGKTRRVGLLVCERFWMEPLGAISPASIEAEGFETVKEFRAYWRGRYNDRFDRFQRVWCIALRPYEPADEERFKDKLYDLLIRGPLEEVARASQQS
jgi:hypothetical protein